MTTEEIRQYGEKLLSAFPETLTQIGGTITLYQAAKLVFLREIAAQLAVLNKQLQNRGQL
jgi:hypothetical protein